MSSYYAEEPERRLPTSIHITNPSLMSPVAQQQQQPQPGPSAAALQAPLPITPQTPQHLGVSAATAGALNAGAYKSPCPPARYLTSDIPRTPRSPSPTGFKVKESYDEEKDEENNGHNSYNDRNQAPPTPNSAAVGGTSHSSFTEQPRPPTLNNVAAASENKENNTNASDESASKDKQPRRLGMTVPWLVASLTISLIVLFALIGGITGALVTRNRNNNNDAPPVDESPPTMAPTASLANETSNETATTAAPLPSTDDPLLNLLTSVAPDPTTLTTTGSPQELAYLSIVADNVTTLTDDRVIQRYALRTLFYATGGAESWTYFDFWDTALDECLWYTLSFDTICDNGEIFSRLELSGNNLVGQLPAELALLTGLQSLLLNNNLLSGPLPDLSPLTQLYDLQLQGNADLTGSVTEATCTNVAAALAAGSSNATTVVSADCDTLTCTCCTVCCEPGVECVVP